MPSLSRQPSTAPAQQATPPVVTPPEPESQRGNQAVAEEAAAAGPAESPGHLTWDAALGSTVGGRLYDLLADQLTEDKLVGHANKAVDAAMGKLKGYIAGAAEPSEQEAAALFTQHLDTTLRGLARQAVVDTNASAELRDLVGGHPYEVALAALAGAVAYVLSNQDLPLIEQKIGLGGGFAIVAGIDVGRTMALAVEQVRVGLKYTGGGAEVTVQGDAFQDGGWQLQGQYAQKLSPTEQLSLSGLHVQRPGEDRSRIDLGYKAENLTAGAYWERTHKDNVTLDTYGGSLGVQGRGPDPLQGYMRGRVSSDNSWEAAGGLSKKFNDSGSLSVEGYAGQNALGQRDSGVRALFKWTF